MTLDQLKSTDFAPYLHQVFAIHYGAAEPLRAELTTVTELGPAPTREGAPQRAPFSIILRGPMRPILPQRIYHIEHERMGALDIFIVPIGPDQAGMRYEAIFG